MVSKHNEKSLEGSLRIKLKRAIGHVHSTGPEPEHETSTEIELDSQSDRKVAEPNLPESTLWERFQRKVVRHKYPLRKFLCPCIPIKIQKADG